AHRQAKADRTLDRAAVQYRQDTGQRDIDGRRLRVRGGAEGRRRARKYLRCGRQLRMRLETDDDLPGHWTTLRAARFGADSRSGRPFALMARTPSEFGDASR